MTTVLLPNNSRGQKALALVTDGALEHALYLEGSNTLRLVPSQSKPGAFYVVDADSCTCPDRTYRKAICKHMQALRVASVLALAEQANGSGAPAASHTNGRVIPASQIERED